MFHQRLGPPARPVVAGAIEAIVAERLLRLDARARLVVEIAALLVRDLDPAMLAAALGWSRRTVAAALERGQSDSLLVAGATAGSARFAHALIRGAVRSQIGFERRRALHERLASALERRPDAAARPDELAHYWWEAGVAARSRVYDERAGDAALTVNAADAAAAHYRRAQAASERGSPGERRLATKLTNLASFEGEVRSNS
jgi:predicted ATPase